MINFISLDAIQIRKQFVYAMNVKEMGKKSLSN